MKLEKRIFLHQLGYVQCSIQARAQVSRILVAVIQVKNLRVVCFLDAGCPVDPLLNLHAEADVVSGVDLQGLEWGSKLESWDALDVNVLLKVHKEWLDSQQKHSGFSTQKHGIS